MGYASALRAFCWIGAVVDALAVVALLSPAVSRGMLGVDVPPTALLYATRTGASRRPLERHAAVFLTVVPVILGFLATEVVGVREGFLPAPNASPLLGLQAPLGVFGLRAWRRAITGERKAA